MRGAGIATVYEEGQQITVLGNRGNLQKDGHTLLRWNTQSDGSGDGYAPGATFAIGSADVTLYAQWNPPLADEENVQEAFNAVVKETIEGDTENGFEAIDGEEGAYEYTQTGGGSLRFWQINASGTISFDVTLAAVGGGSTAGDVKVYLVDHQSRPADRRNKRQSGHRGDGAVRHSR